MDKEAREANAQKLAGQAKQTKGELTGNHRMKADGAIQQVKGSLRQTLGAVKHVTQEAKEGAREGRSKASRARHP